MVPDEAPAKDKPKEGESTILEGSAFESLERDFQQVLQELVGDKSLERFRTEYEKLHRALKKSHESEKRLVKKARELNSEIVQNAQKVQTALKLSQEDQNTIASLKREIEKAWKMVDAAHDKEGRAKETIGQLKTEISNLSRLVEQGAGLSVGQESTVNELMKVKNELMRERDNASAQVLALKGEVSDYLTKVANIENDAAQQRGTIEMLQDQIAARKADAEREAARKEKLESELRGLRESLDERQADLRSTVASIQGSNEAISRTEHLLRDERARTDRTTKEADVLAAKNGKQSAHLDELTFTAAQLVREGAERAIELRVREDEVSAHRREIAKLEAQVDGLGARAAAITRAQGKLDEERTGLKVGLHELEQQLDEARRLNDNSRKAKEAVSRERDLLNKQLGKSQALTRAQADAVAVHENARKNLEQEISAHKADAYRQRKAILTVERQCEALQLELREAAGKHAQAAEELRAREASVLALQKRIGDVDNKLKQQQNLYEAVRADRGLYNKSLLDAKEEIGEMRRKFKVMNHQIEQLKDDIHLKDQSLVREHFDHMKVAKERDALREEVARVSKQMGQADEALLAYRAELAKLGAVIGEADAETARQAKETEIVLNERELLGLQLLRRNEELGLLYEKIRIHESMLHKGEGQYAQATQTVAALKGRLAELRGHVGALRASVVSVGSIRSEVYQLARELLHERAKVKALEGELAKPLNVHRWRKLEGSDPAAYEMLQKIQLLQKRLIGKASESVSKSSELAAKDRLYAELKAILARQPGPEIAEQLAAYRNSLKEKDQQSEQMASELAMYHAQVSEYKGEIERVVKELHEVKAKFYEQKRKEQAFKERTRHERTKSLETAVSEARASLPRFTGGGFSLQRH